VEPVNPSAHSGETGSRVLRLLAVNNSTDIRARRDSWFVGAFFLTAFCFLGFFTAKLAPLFQGMESTLPAAVRFIVAYGPVAFPLFGVLAATSFVVSNRLFQRQWPQWALIVLYALIVLWAFGSLVAPRFITGASFSANKSLQPTAASLSANDGCGRFAALWLRRRVVSGGCG
jgi:hypothetical protein